MNWYALKLFITTIFSLLIMYFYYIVFPFHQPELWNPYLYIYAAIIGFIYICYKCFYIWLGYREIVFTPFKIFLWFCVHLFLLSWFFFVVNDMPFTSWIILFFKILFFTSIPFLFFLIFHSFGSRILSFYKIFSTESQIFQFFTSIGFGFFSFIFLVTIASFFWFYNQAAIILLLWIFSILSYKELWKWLQFLCSYKITFQNHSFASPKISEKVNPYLLSTEFLFIVLSWLIAINLISVMRPFPIGWDDLGVYMNYPKLLAQAGWMIPLGQMTSWQFFTGIWFLFWSQTLAFFINSFSWILAWTGIFLFIKWLVSDRTDKKTYINIPLLWAAIFLAMPMVIFQIAKDMKLDIALLFISLVPIFMLCYIFSKKDNSFSHNKIYYLIIGILLWFIFSIKVTSLLLIIATLWALFFSHLRILWFIGYLAIFFAVFTKLGLWNLMNVVYPSNNLDFINYFSLISLCIWIWCILYAAFPKKLDVSVELTKKFGVLLLWMLIALSPWLIKNIADLGITDVPVSRLIWWEVERFSPDYSLIYSEIELEKIEEADAYSRINTSGKTDNEDFGRYFWYEEWINNYIKLPWNLTMQINQGWDFTNISYIFLALLPVLLLFLPYRRKYTEYTIVWILLFELFLFLNFPSNQLLTDIFASVSLPLWYAPLLWFFLLPLLFFSATLDKRSYIVKLFMLNLAFTIIYIFLWNISAFWVVWYGIVMYVTLILMVSICFYFLSSYDSDNENWLHFFWSIIVFCIVSTYFVVSSMPMMMNNLQQASYPEYKLGAVNEDESIFIAHSDYLPILFELNINEESKQEFLSYYKKSIQQILGQWQYNPEFAKVVANANSVKWLLEFFDWIESLQNKDIELIVLKSELKSIRRDMYNRVIYPEKENRNHSSIYRMWTFMKYFISENNSRLLEDNLITKFDKYIYDENPDITVSRMKTLWLDHLLVDLNAATIDQDPRRDLTRRYEGVLKTFTSSQMTLIETDSICFNVAIEKYRSDRNMEEYITLAWVNYDSYTEISKISRGEKLQACHTYILKLFQSGEVTTEKNAYLLPLYQYLQRKNIDISDDVVILRFLRQFVRGGYKVLFKID